MFRNRWMALAVALAAGTSACSDLEPPMEPGDPTQSVAAGGPSDETPFYYHQGERILLDVEPTELVVASRIADAGAAAREVLASLGVTPVSELQLPQAAGHVLLTLPASTSRARALEARDRVRQDARFQFAAVGYRTRGDRAQVLLLNRVGVSFREGTSRPEIHAIAARAGARIVREPNPSKGAFSYWLEYGPGTDPLAVAAALDRHPDVAWADPDKVSDRKPQYIPSDPYFPHQYYLRNDTRLNGVRVDINTVHAWDFATGAWAPSTGGFTIAVVDDGVQSSHPDLDGHVSWGFDAFGINDGYATNPECENDSHGTMVAGTILQQHNNGIGGAGGAPGVYVFPVRIFRCGWAASDTQIADGLNYAWYWQGAHVLNNSWGGGAASNAITNAINNGDSQGRGGKGAVFVFSGGNTSNRDGGHVGGLLYPSTLSASVAVGAINRNGYVTNYSPEGSALDIVAPSGHYTGACIGDVVTTDLLGTRGCDDGPGGDIDYTSTFSGTSAAAPQVAAVFSQLLARESGLTSSQAKSRVYNAADYWGASSRFGRGKVNAYRTHVGRLTAYINGESYVMTEGEYTWTASSTGGTETPQFTWEFSWDGISWSTVATGTSYSRWVTLGENFYLRLTARQGPDDSVAVDQLWVQTACDSGGTEICIQ